MTPLKFLPTTARSCGRACPLQQKSPIKLHRAIIWNDQNNFPEACHLGGVRSLWSAAGSIPRYWGKLDSRFEDKDWGLGADRSLRHPGSHAGDVRQSGGQTRTESQTNQVSTHSARRPGRGGLVQIPGARLPDANQRPAARLHVATRTRNDILV